MRDQTVKEFHLPFANSVFIKPFEHPKTKRYAVTKVTTYLVVDRENKYEMLEHTYEYDEEKLSEEIDWGSKYSSVYFKGKLGETWKKDLSEEKNVENLK